MLIFFFYSFTSTFFLLTYKFALFLKFLEHLKKVNFKTKEGEEVYFDINGDPPAKYEIINWQLNKNNQSEFITVGLYDSSLPAPGRLAVNLSSIVWAKNSNKVSIR